MLIKFFLCFVIFISSLQNSFAKNNVSEQTINLKHSKATSVVRQPPNDPPGVVYRADSRPLAAIIAAGGFRTWADLNEARADNSLTNHLNGASLIAQNSNFVSTSSTFRDALRHAFYLYIMADTNFEPLYIYRIRPDSHFFDADASMIQARDAFGPEDPEWEELDHLATNLSGYSEYVSQGTIGADRIISVSGAITGRFLQNYQRDILINEDSPVFDENFEEYLWFPHAGYNSAHDNDRANRNVFTPVNAPAMEALPIVNDTVVDIEPRFSCLGLGAGFSSSKYVNNLPACSAREKFDLVTIPYSYKMKMTLLNASQFH